MKGEVQSRMSRFKRGGEEAREAGKESKRLDYLEVLREILGITWLDTKGIRLVKQKEGGLREGVRKRGKGGKWEEEYGIVAGGLYLEEEVDNKTGAYMPTKGKLVGIRGRGRKRRRGRGTKKLEQILLGTLRRRFYLGLEKPFNEIYKKAEGGDKESIRKRELIKGLVKNITHGKRITIQRFRSIESDKGTIGETASERFLIEKRVWVEPPNPKNGKIVIKYLLRWEHIGKLKYNKENPPRVRFIKEKDK